jgi:hypothetical protein
MIEFNQLIYCSIIFLIEYYSAITNKNPNLQSVQEDALHQELATIIIISTEIWIFILSSL